MSHSTTTYHLHPTIDNERLNLSRHEVSHATLAHLCGYVVDGIELGSDKGCTIINYGVAPATFADHYAKSPLRASLALVQILAIIRIGHYAELHGGMHGSQSIGQDLADMERWRSAVVQMGGQEWWTRMYTESIRGLQAWYKHDSVQRCISDMAPVLADNRVMSRYALLTLMEQAGVGSIPEPHFVPVISPARYMPGAKAATPQCRPATAGMDLSRFARDSRGHIRPFTTAEWGYVKTHGMQSLQNACSFTDDELETVVANMERDVARQQGRGLARR